MKTNQKWIWALLGAILLGISGCVVDPGHRGGYYDDHGYGHGYGYEHQDWDHDHGHDWHY